MVVASAPSSCAIAACTPIRRRSILEMTQTPFSPSVLVAKIMYLPASALVACAIRLRARSRNFLSLLLILLPLLFEDKIVALYSWLRRFSSFELEYVERKITKLLKAGKFRILQQSHGVPIMPVVVLNYPVENDLPSESIFLRSEGGEQLTVAIELFIRINGKGTHFAIDPKFDLDCLSVSEGAYLVSYLFDVLPIPASCRTR